MNGNIVLNLSDVSIGYQTPTGTVKAVVDASLSLSQGDTLGIVGESGSGKSTLAHGILRLLPRNAVVEGEMFFSDTDLLNCSDKTLKNLRWKEIAVVFQKSMNSFSPVHRIGEQIVDIYRVHEPEAARDEVYDRIRELFAIVNLSDRVLESFPHQLSGGMLQRVCISLSLIHQPQLVIFDEATTALDVVTQGQVLKEIRRLESELDVTSILITHDVSVVAETCRRVAVMYAGYIMEIGPVERVFSDPLHPYTQGLLASFPSLKGEKKRLQGIPGTLPDLKAKHSGCIFAPRCPKAIGLCHEESPPVTDVEPDHAIRCHLTGGEQ
ncbi:MAG TPA: ABC transporter ATP-binding protein [Firmicutes bacterium]|nr:ABC transporter ATP-binding protein [Bacillota bacterium]